MESSLQLYNPVVINQMVTGTIYQYHYSSRDQHCYINNIDFGLTVVIPSHLHIYTAYYSNNKLILLHLLINVHYQCSIILNG